MTGKDNSTVSDGDSIISDDANKVDADSTRSNDEWQKLLRQRKATQEKNSELNARVKELEELERKREETTLAEKQQYKELADRYKSDLESVREEKSKLENSFLDAHKLNAFREKLPGSVKKSEYYSFVDLSKIIVDPDSGEIINDSVDGLVNDFITNYPDLYVARDGKKLPGDAPKGDSKPKTYIEELKACKTQRELDAVRRKHNRA